MFKRCWTKWEKTCLCTPISSSNKIRIYQSNPILSSGCPSQAWRPGYTESSLQYYFSPFGFLYVTCRWWHLASAHSVSLHVLPLEINSSPDSKQHTVEWSEIIVVDKQNQGALNKAEDMLKCSFIFKWYKYMQNEHYNGF